MKTEHIKSVAMITDTSAMWAHFEFPEDMHWHVVFEVSQEFKRAFFDHMREILHPMNIYSSGVIASDTLSEEEIADLDTFIYDGSSWFLNDAGTCIIRSTEFDDHMEKEIPEDWWMDNIALLKAVLAKV